MMMSVKPKYHKKLPSEPSTQSDFQFGPSTRKFGDPGSQDWLQ